MLLLDGINYESNPQNNVCLSTLMLTFAFSCRLLFRVEARLDSTQQEVPPQTPFSKALFPPHFIMHTFRITNALNIVFKNLKVFRFCIYCTESLTFLEKELWIRR